jgi:tRNA(fMet)-specific endonuclease VapC
MDRYLLDTDIIIDVSRGNANAAKYVDSLSDAAISIITAQELIAGARDKRDLAEIDSLISTYPIEHLDAAVGLRAYDLLKEYAKSHGLRAFDSLIAATAMERGLVLVTRNRKHFAMIDGLRIEVPRF